MKEIQDGKIRYEINWIKCIICAVANKIKIRDEKKRYCTCTLFVSFVFFSSLIND